MCISRRPRFALGYGRQGGQGVERYQLLLQVNVLKKSEQNLVFIGEAGLKSLILRAFLDFVSLALI